MNKNTFNYCKDQFGKIYFKGNDFIRLVYHATKINPSIDDIRFGGKEIASQTFHREWWSLEEVPTFAIVLNRKNKIVSHTLKDPNIASDALPITITKDAYHELSGLIQMMYKPEYEYEIEEIRVDFESVKQFDGVIKNITKGIDGAYEIKYPSDQSPRFTSKDNLVYELIDEISIPPIFLSSRPCKLNSQISFNIIRNHVKKNINAKFAYISSDYDFVFTVSKKLTLSNPYSYETEIKENRRTKKVKRFVNQRNVTLFEIGHKGPWERNAPFSEDTKIINFEGQDEEDLVRNIQKYLDDLMKEINKPLKECTCCQGSGVVICEE